MTLKRTLLAFLCTGIMTITLASANAQDENKKQLERPKNCAVAQVDNFVNKSFDSYDESLKITQAATFTFEGEGSEKIVKNAEGETLSKADALLQLGELLVRAKKQSDNIQTLQDLQKPATESLKKCPVTKKPKATSNLNKGTEALSEVIKETKNQVELINKQIEETKTLND